MPTRPHKAFVVCTDDVWKDFRVLCVQRDRTVQAALGVLVVAEVSKAKKAATATDKRRAAAAKTIAKELRSIQRGEVT
jgi:hypothetical protein